MLQARVDRMEFGGSLPVKANLKQNVPLKYSHFVSLDGSELLEAATKDLVSIFQLKVGTHAMHFVVTKPRKFNTCIMRFPMVLKFFQKAPSF